MMEQTILTLGQAALLLASVVAVLGIVYVALWLASGIVRKVRELANPCRSKPPPVHRPNIGAVRGSAKKW